MHVRACEGSPSQPEQQPQPAQPEPLLPPLRPQLRLPPRRPPPLHGSLEPIAEPQHRVLPLPNQTQAVQAEDPHALPREAVQLLSPPHATATAAAATTATGYSQLPVSGPAYDRSPADPASLKVASCSRGLWPDPTPSHASAPPTRPASPASPASPGTALRPRRRPDVPL